MRTILDTYNALLIVILIFVIIKSRKIQWLHETGHPDHTLAFPWYR